MSHTHFKLMLQKEKAQLDEQRERERAVDIQNPLARGATGAGRINEAPALMPASAPPRIKTEPSGSLLENPTSFHLQALQQQDHSASASSLGNFMFPPSQSPLLDQSPAAADLRIGSAPTSAGLGQVSASAPASQGAGLFGLDALASLIPDHNTLTALLQQQQQQQLLAAAAQRLSLQSPLSSQPSSLGGMEGGSSLLATLAASGAVEQKDVEELLDGLMSMDTAEGKTDTGPGVVNLDSDVLALSTGTSPSSRGGSVSAPSSLPNDAPISAEEKPRPRERIKKDNHNLIERRRRFNINDRIKELGTLLPGTDSDSRHNKGSILKASVDYIRRLQKAETRHRAQAQRQRQLENVIKAMKQRIQELEILCKAHNVETPSLSPETSVLAQVNLAQMTLEQCVTVLDGGIASGSAQAMDDLQSGHTSEAETTDMSTIGQESLDMDSDDDLDTTPPASAPASRHTSVSGTPR